MDEPPPPMFDDYGHDPFFDLSLQAHSLLSQLPLSKQRSLTTETRQIFQNYSFHGSGSRLCINVKQFLEGTLDRPHKNNSNQDSDSDSDSEKKTEVRLSHYLIFENFSSINQFRSSASDNTHSYTTDSPSASLAIELPFHPADTFLVWDPRIECPDEVIIHLSNIHALHNIYGRRLLAHHVAKYPSGASGTDLAPLFRVGITEYIQSLLATAFDTPDTDPLGLTTETRRFLRSVYERLPDLGPVDIVLVARSARVDQETVEMFWDDMTAKRRAWWAMRTVIAAAELRREQIEKKLIRESNAGTGDGDVELD